MEDKTEYSPLSMLLFILAGLSVVGGFVLSAQLWPQDAGAGRSWPTIAYVPALIWLVGGVAQGAILASIAQGLEYLKRIAINTGGARPRGLLEESGVASSDGLAEDRSSPQKEMPQSNVNLQKAEETQKYIQLPKSDDYKPFDFWVPAISIVVIICFIVIASEMN